MDYDIAVIAANEEKAIAKCVYSIDSACAGRRARIVVILNGTTDRSSSILRSIALKNSDLSVYLINAANKANAINRFFYDLRLDAGTYFCIDGYITVRPGALHALERALRVHPKALVASAIPVNGRSAKATRKATLKGGMVSGQLFAMVPDFVRRMVKTRLRLPLNTYRGDGLLGSIAAHDFDATGTAWDNSRIVGVAEAGFEILPLSAFKWSDIRRQYQREIRQARGALEVAAIKAIIYTEGFGALPEDADDMIRRWCVSNRLKARTLRERYFMRLALKQLYRARRTVSSSDLVPKLIFSTN